MTKTVSILGSTGSIGRQTLSVVEHLGLSVAALTCGSSLDLMEQQCRKFRPALAVVSTPELAAQLRARLSDLPEIEIQHGEAGLLAAASLLAGSVGFCASIVRMLQNLDGADLSGLRAPLNVACLNLCYPLFLCLLLLPVWVSLERRSRAQAREVREGKGRQTALLRPVDRSKTG